MFKAVTRDVKFVAKALISDIIDRMLDSLKNRDPGGLYSIWVASIEEDAAHYRDTLRLAVEIRKILHDTAFASDGKTDKVEKHLEYLDRITFGLDHGLLSAQSLLKKLTGDRGPDFHLELEEPPESSRPKPPRDEPVDYSQLKKPPAFTGFGPNSSKENSNWTYPETSLSPKTEEFTAMSSRAEFKDE